MISDYKWETYLRQAYHVTLDWMPIREPMSKDHCPPHLEDEFAQKCEKHFAEQCLRCKQNAYTFNSQLECVRVLCDHPFVFDTTISLLTIDDIDSLRLVCSHMKNSWTVLWVCSLNFAPHFKTIPTDYTLLDLMRSYGEVTNNSFCKCHDGIVRAPNLSKHLCGCERYKRRISLFLTA